MQDEKSIHDYFHYPGHTLLIGATMQGKSNLLKSLILGQLESHTFQCGHVFTVKVNGDYKWLPDENVHEGFDWPFISRWLDHLEKIKIKRDSEGKKMVQTFMILDDLVCDKGVTKYYDQWSSLVTKARHFGISLFITTQHLNSKVSSTVLRNNIKYLWMYRPTTKKNWTNIYDWFGSALAPTLKEFQDLVIDKLKESQYWCFCILIENQQDTSKKQYLSFLAPHPDELKNFKVNFKQCEKAPQK